jgi:hypothetical protein
VSLHIIASPKVFKGKTRNGITTQLWLKPTNTAYSLAPAK